MTFGEEPSSRAYEESGTVEFRSAANVVEAETAGLIDSDATRLSALSKLSGISKTSSQSCAACCLPTMLDVSDHYLELAARIGEQGAASYCNVLLFVSPDRSVRTVFSLTHLAQAFALQCPGDVLLIDGDFAAEGYRRR